MEINSTYIFLAFIYLFPPFRFFLLLWKRIKGYRPDRELIYYFGTFLHGIHFFGVVVMLLYIYKVSQKSGAEGVGWVFIFAIPIQVILIVLCEGLLALRGRMTKKNAT